MGRSLHLTLIKSLIYETLSPNSESDECTFLSMINSYTGKRKYLSTLRFTRSDNKEFVFIACASARTSAKFLIFAIVDLFKQKKVLSKKEEIEKNTEREREKDRKEDREIKSRIL